MSSAGPCGSGRGAAPGPCDASPAFPLPIENRPALPRIGYRVGTYSTIRERLLQDLNRDPNLGAWTYREPDDPAIALIEGVAILGDILTFYQELYANEAFLRTAQWRESVARLTRLLGYRLSPGVGGKATFAFEVTGDTSVVVPAGFPLKVELADGSADFETVADSTAYPWLSRFFLYRPLREGNIQRGTRRLRVVMPDGVEILEGDRLILGSVKGGTATVPDQLEEPQVVVVEEVSRLHGQTVVTIEGAVRRSAPKAELAAFKLGRTFRHFGHNAPHTEVTLDSSGNAKGAPIEYYRRLTTSTEETYIDPVLEPETLPLDTQVDDFPEGGLVVCTYRNASLPVLGIEEAFYPTGQDSASPVYMDPSEYQVEYMIGQPVNTPQITMMMQGAGAHLRPDSLTFDLNEAEIRVSGGAQGEVDIPGEDRGTQYTVVRQVVGVEGDSLRWGATTGASTVLALSADVFVDETDLSDIRTFQIHEVTSPILRVFAAPVDASDSSGDSLYCTGKAEHARDLLNREIMLERASGDPLVRTVVTVETDDPLLSAFPGLHKIWLNEDVTYDDFPQEPESDDGTAYGNLVAADQGKTEKESVLGSGDRRETFQTFRLPNSPLTYHRDSASTPPETPDATVLVNGRAWTRVESLYRQAPDAEVYVVREDDAGRSYVQFGDGTRFGARLPSGVDNVVARYRTGVGAFGPKKLDTKVQARERLEGLDGVELVRGVTGGGEAEPIEEARAAAPGRVVTLNRLVGLQDYEAEAMAMSGVALARATWSLLDGIPTIVVAVLMEHGRESDLSDMEDSLEKANIERGASRHPVLVTPASFREVYLDARYATEPRVEGGPVAAAIERALGVVDDSDPTAASRTGLFSLPRRRLGQAEYAGRVTGVIQSVEGVAWAEVVAFQVLAAGTDPSLPGTASRQDVASCGGAEVLRLRKRIEQSPFRLTRVAGVSEAGAGVSEEGAGDA